MSSQSPSPLPERVALQQIVRLDTGEVIDPRNLPDLAGYLAELRRLKREELDPRIRQVTAAAVELAREYGKQTLEAGGVKLRVKRKIERHWNVPVLRHGLQKAGVPEERLAQLIRKRTVYDVSWQVARELSAANPAYKAVIEDAMREEEGDPYVEVSGA
jgi:transposase